MRIFVIMITALLTIYGCKSSKIEDVSTTTVPYIELKSGGGFAGKYTTYLLFENGQVFEQKSEFQSSVPVGDIEKNAAKQIFANYDLLNFTEVDHETYGNYTYTISKQDGGKKHQIVWEKDQDGTDTYKLFFKNAMKEIESNIEFNSPKEAVKE